MEGSLHHAALHDGCAACRACFDSLIIRTILPGADRSIVGFGPDCSYIALHDCDLDGISGLLVPRTKVRACSQCCREAAMLNTLLFLVFFTPMTKVAVTCMLHKPVTY